MSAYSRHAKAAGRPVRLADGTELTLEHVSDSVEQGEFLSWSLLFRGPGDQLLAQGLHPLIPDDLGEQAIFLVPLGPNGDHFEYEAVFSQRCDAVNS